jgi:hypothetical protein
LLQDIFQTSAVSETKTLLRVAIDQGVDISDLTGDT